MLLKRRKDTTRLRKVCDTSNNEIMMLYHHCDIVGRLVVVIDVNPSHGFWTRRLMKLFGHEGK
jgi:hypothetical protein